jgi:hypothetical protein
MSNHLTISSHTKIAVGSALAATGGVLMVLAPLVGWYSLPGPWDFLLGFVTGLLAGLGATLAIAGLVERKHEG